MDPVSGVQYGMTNKNDTDGLGEEYQYMDEVWNGNLWLSSWLGGGLSAYLVGSLMMASPHRKRGVVVLGDSSIEGTNGCGGTVLDANNIDESGHSDEIIDGYVYRRKYASDEEGPVIGSCHWQFQQHWQRSPLKCEQASHVKVVFLVLHRTANGPC
eukprot:g9975.t1 g9975   contig4:988109-988576(+)